ncbi:hypothetical protein ACVWXU_000760 [Streptomyces sp. TE33382]
MVKPLFASGSVTGGRLDADDAGGRTAQARTM